MKNSINYSWINKRDFWIAGLIFLISFVVYLKTLCPTVYVGDSGELIAAAYTLGIPHPPGYPLYCLLGRLFTFLPFGSIAYRINLMSAFFASLTIVLVYLIILHIPHPTSHISHQNVILRHLPAFAAALIFTFSKSFWSQAVVAEIYTLKAFFLALLIFILLKWKESLLTPNSPSGTSSPLGTRGELSERSGDSDPSSPCSSGQTPNSTRYLYLFALIYGLSFSNHITMMIFFPAFLYFALITDWRAVFHPKNIILVILLFTLGLAFYLYLPIRSLQNPTLDWGDPQTLKAFINHVTGKQYHFRLFTISITQLPSQIKEYFTYFGKEYTWLPLLIGLFGLGHLLKEKRRLFFFFLLIFFTNSIFNICQSTIKAPAHFFLPSYLVFALWVGYGIKYLLKRGEEVNRKINFGGKSIYRYVAPLLILSLPLLSLSRSYFCCDRSRHYLAYDYGMNILKTLEKDAILFTSGDNPTFITAYLTTVEKKRPDVTIYHRSGNLYQDIYGFSQLPRKELTAEKKSRRRGQIEKRIINNTSRPVYYIRDVSGELSDYSLKPEGLLYRVQREGTEIEDDHNYWKDYQMRGIENERIFKDYSTRGVIAEYYYRIGRYYSRNKKREEAITAYLQAQRAGWIIEGGHIKLGLAFQEEGAIEEAIQEFARAVELNPQLISGYSNLGACYALKGQYQKAEDIWKKALNIDPENKKLQKNLEKLKRMEVKQ